MKPDFKKWLVETNKDGYYPVSIYRHKEINQFAEDYGKQEAIEFAKYISKNWYRMDIDKYVFPYYMGKDRNKNYTIGQLYQKFKDES